jgi:hypothetical protein
VDVPEAVEVLEAMGLFRFSVVVEAVEAVKIIR